MMRNDYLPIESEEEDSASESEEDSAMMLKPVFVKK
jgi:hypothetical protein